jgi:hypothetical protein
LSFFFKYRFLESLKEKECTEGLTQDEWVLMVRLQKEIYD